MRALTVTGVVGPDHTLSVPVPPDVATGLLEVVVVLPEVTPRPKGPVRLEDWPAIPGILTNPHDTFRREDIYGDDGR